MGRWLDALRKGKNLGNASGHNLRNHQNPLPDGSEGFEGGPSGAFENFQSGWDEDDWHFAFEERAAILEFDEGLSRPEAEALAAEQIAEQRRGNLLDRRPAGRPN